MSEVQLFSFNVPPELGSVVFPLICISIFDPVCAPELISVNADARFVYIPFPALAPDTVTFRFWKVNMLIFPLTGNAAEVSAAENGYSLNDALLTPTCAIDARS